MMRIDECREKSRFTSKGEIVLRGERIPYHTVCEDNFFLADDGHPVATIFSYAYFRSDVQDPSTRPVLFCYNGGPGCGSLWVHLGLFGPRRLKLGKDELRISPTPPFELEDNPYCLLDMCDLVMVDPPDTGLGRLVDESAASDFFDADGDVRAMAMFIDQWLTRYHRHNSPVLLGGESYGTFRSAKLVGELLGAGPLVRESPTILGISVSGIMLLGSAFLEDLPVEKSVLNLMSMAATNHYHHPEGKPGLREFVDEAYDYAQGEYISALYWGDELSPEKKKAVAQKLAYFSGVNEEFWMSHNLRLNDMREYMNLVLESEGKAVGYYDGRYTWPLSKTFPNANGIADDAAMGQYTPGFQAAFALLRDELGITFDRSSKSLNMGINQLWNRKFKASPSQSLAGAMRRNRKLRVFFASGLYDLCTTAGNARYLASHSNLDMSRVKRGEYPSGHMAYLGEESMKLLCEDMREFFTQALAD